MKFLLLIFRNVGRNMLRSVLTALGTMGLVLVVTLVWSVLKFLDNATAEKSQNLKAIITEKWQIPSQMPMSYAATLCEGGARKEGDVRPLDSMTWQFYGGTLDPTKQTPENMLFAIATEPRKIYTMMDELDSLPPPQKADLERLAQELEKNRRGMVLGKDRLAAINKQVGDRLVVHSINFKEIDLEFEILGTFPKGRWDNTAAMNSEYLNAALDAYQRKNGKPHPMAGKSLNLVWLRLPDQESFNRVSEQIVDSPYYSNPAVKCETASSGISTFLEAYRDLIWAMRWLLSPAILITLSLVIANAISISVRERRKELAVLKVLGFRPAHILVLVLGEAVLLGAFAGFASAALTLCYINYIRGGFTFPIAFFGAFYIPFDALWWGTAIGAGAALVGSIVPAWSARSVKVSEVFAKVA